MRARHRTLASSVVFVLFTFLAVLGARAQPYSEAPQLAERVAAGELRPVEERLPENPLVVEPLERVGDYGGTWRSGLGGGGDIPWLVRTMGYENLVRWDVEWTEVIPNVAESFEVNDDGTEFTFYLREGMRWSDGAPFTADDIVFWYEDVLLHAELSPLQPGVFLGGELVEVRQQDDYTVTFVFNQPNGLFLQNLATPGGAWPTIFPRHYAQAFHADYNPDIDALVRQEGVEDWLALFNDKVGWNARWRNREMPTLYGWMFTTAYGESTTAVVAERNPYYFKVDPEGNQLPYLDRLVYEIGVEVEAFLARTLQGGIDMQDRHIATQANRPILAESMALGDYRFFETIPDSMNTMIIAFNLTHLDPVKREIFGNKDFRIGLSHAIDREEIIDAIYVGQGEPFQAAPRPESELYNERLATQYTEYDVGLANDYLDRAFPDRDGEGFRLGPDGQRISFVVEVIAVAEEQISALELIRGYWREVGVEIEVWIMDRVPFYARKETNAHDANVWDGDGGLNAILEPRWYFPFSHESNFALAWAAWYNPTPLPEVQPEEPPTATQEQLALYDELRTTADEERQAELMNEILEIAAEEFYVIGVSLPGQGYGIVKNNFRNVPDVMPAAWLYPHPGPTNPEQYFIEIEAER
jgi:peptide/nickel transport system substrate-binding protein